MAEEKLIKRSQKKTFCDVGDSSPDFELMRGFTSITTNKEAKEYSRQYVDEDFERTDVVGINTSIDFAFDQYTGNDVHDLIVDIIDNEKIGEDAYIDILSVDLSGVSPFTAKKRTVVVIPGSEGDGFDAYAYSGMLRAVSEVVQGTATVSGTKATFTATETPEG